MYYFKHIRMFCASSQISVTPIRVTRPDQKLYCHSNTGDVAVNVLTKLCINMANSFLYFAYGSNLLTKRIRINNPTAIKKDIGRLKNFRLDFITFSKRWHGAAATIVPTENSHVWGVIWEIDNSNMSDLDEQEAVADKMYFPMTVDVETPNGTTLQCRVYQQCKNPEENVKTELLPEERRPSPLYLNMILSGARENGLPHEYIQFLQSIPHNGYSGESDISLPLREQ